MALGSFRKPNKDIRSIYMNMVGRLTLDDLVDRLKTESEEVLYHICKLLDGRIEVTDFPFWNHTQLYKYAFYGELFREAHPQVIGDRLEGGSGFIATDTTRDADALMCLLSVDFEDPYGFAGDVSSELKAAYTLVFNTAATRAYVDCWRLRPDQHPNEWLNLHEMALLAQMKVTTLRNRANPKSPDPIKTIKKKRETGVLIEDALDWLERNTKYKPTVFPTKPSYLDEGNKQTFSEQEIKNAIYSYLCD